jgi:hypothetical protein
LLIDSFLFMEIFRMSQDASVPDQPDVPEQAVPFADALNQADLTSETDVAQAIIEQHRAIAFRRTWSLAALAGINTADLTEFARRFQRLLDSAMSNAETLADLQQLDRPVQRWLDVVRQSDRSMRFEQDLVDSFKASD